ncbi:ABC transporter substrate-binding protein [Psychromonas ossibalaenae]|uniref:ABC transporter substrate-binding protein n=1 Tax=Psychromonas ossibalaenae TaxID=444922 RepID=UPI0003755872|nr:ABC transporter substrate-binding protein [Psychromonas ossibalaenae]
MRLISLVFVLLISVYAGSIYNDIGKDSGGNKAAITIAVSKTPLSAPFYIAESQGYFSDSCVNVVINDVIGGKKSFEQVVTGDADFGTSSDSVIVFQALQRHDFVTLASFAQSDNDVKLITRIKNNIHESADLAGRRIGLIRGTASEYLLSTYLALSGLTIRDVILKALSAEQLPQALEQNKVDLIVPWEPYAFMTVESLNSDARTLNTKNLHTLMFNLISRRLVDTEKVEQAVCVMQALNHAVNYIAAEPDKSRKIIVERIGTYQKFIDWVWPDYIFKLSLNRSLLMSLQSQTLWLRDSDKVGTAELPDYRMLLDNRVLKKVNPMAVKL